MVWTNYGRTLDTLLTSANWLHCECLKLFESYARNQFLGLCHRKSIFYQLSYNIAVDAKIKAQRRSGSVPYRLRMNFSTNDNTRTNFILYYLYLSLPSKTFSERDKAVNRQDGYAHECFFPCHQVLQAQGSRHWAWHLRPLLQGVGGFMPDCRHYLRTFGNF